MARKKPATEAAFVLFDIIYEDGRRTSNRKIPSADLTGSNNDNIARSFFEAQDNKIAAMSGNPRGLIKSITRSS